jgi:hypothetical protein
MKELLDAAHGSSESSCHEEVNNLGGFDYLRRRSRSQRMCDGHELL